MQSDISDIMKNCREITNLIKVGRKHRTFYVKSYVGFEVADDFQFHGSVHHITVNENINLMQQS